ncbi:hypothetical protein KC19_12G022200 [Ceratodon purpureus]|uniref:DUF7748 domain-containing protein n=1 Tax=Ceratodon purpureus TaxID=3225 RepID=A0A8T0G553_CERPU|nr:hypothetical protein KC19_12G022200 [Ceratodon purpureus]
MKLATVLENGTNSPFEVRSESSSGVHALLTTLRPQEIYKLVRSSSDTYLQHWVVMGDAPVVSFSSDELIDNQRITIVCEGGSVYRKLVVPRHTPKSISMPNRNPESIGGESPTHSLSNAGKPPLSGFKRFFSSLIRRSNSSEVAAASSSDSSSSLRTVGSSPM